MNPRIPRVFLLGACASSLAIADFSYDQTSRVTGGAMMSMMRMNPMARQMREPQKTTVLLKGNRMAHLSDRNGQIIDLDKETFTHVDFEKKTWSVTTFAEMKQAIEGAMQKMSGQGQAPDFKVSVKKTGAAKSIAGQNAEEIVMTIEMQMSDAKSGGRGGMNMENSMWIAGGISGFAEVQAFHKRLAEKISWSPSGGPMMRPEMARAMAEAWKEVSKLDGVPVLMVMRMKGAGMGAGAELTPEQQKQMEEAQAAQPSASDAAAAGAAGAAAGRMGRLGGLAGGLGGFGRRKKPEPAVEAPKPEPAKTEAAPSATPPGVMLETTIESANFSTASVDASKLDVPGGFKQTESEFKRMK